MRDLIMGSITKLGWDRCEHWVNSINKSGFDGDKIICIFGDHKDLVNNFKNNGFQVYNYRTLSDNENICVARFLAYNDILSYSEQKYRKVLATDVTDVVFQKNPTEFFDIIIEKCIIASSENIRYKDESWGANNMRLSFGDDAYGRMKDAVIYNAGVIAGEHQLIQDLFLAIYKMCENKPQHIQGGGALIRQHIIICFHCPSSNRQPSSWNMISDGHVRPGQMLILIRITAKQMLKSYLKYVIMR